MTDRQDDDDDEKIKIPLHFIPKIIKSPKIDVKTPESLKKNENSYKPQAVSFRSSHRNPSAATLIPLWLGYRIVLRVHLEICFWIVFRHLFSAKSERHSPDRVQCAGASAIFQLPALRPVAATRPISLAKATETKSHFLELQRDDDAYALASPACYRTWLPLRSKS